MAVNLRTTTSPSFWLALLLVLVGSGPVSAVQECSCDADGNGIVTVSEMVQAVGNALNGCDSVPGCNGDANCDGVVAVSELIAGVNNLLGGCPVVADDLVVSVAWLQQHLEDEDVQIIDARVGSFPGGHIPGALPLSPYELATTVEGVDFQVVGPDIGADVLSGIGLRQGTTVIVYGQAPEFDPARVVWALLYLGHVDVRYLDGGFAAWVGSGAVVASGDPVADDPTDYDVAAVVEPLRVTGAWVLERLGDPPYDQSTIQVVDARSPAEFDMGRIPTAVHVQWTRNLEEGLLLPMAELEQLYSTLDKSKTTVVYCLAGWRASVAWMVLDYLGFEDVRVYDGSWIEWGAEGSAFPIETNPPFDASGVTSTCHFRNKGGPASKPDLIRVSLTVRNHSGWPLYDVAPLPLAVSGNGKVFDLEGHQPGVRSSMPSGSVASFQWSFDLEGVVEVSVAGTARRTGQERIEFGPAECGPIQGV